MKKYYLLHIFFFISIQFALSQNSITLPIYGDFNEQDTIKKAADILQAEINKAKPVTFSWQRQEDFKGYGILLSANPRKWGTDSKCLKKMGPEAVLVKVSKGSIVILGNSQMAVQHGVFIYLEKLGYRYYFPHPDWYIVPTVQTLFPSFSYACEPSFDHRRIWYAYGTGSAFANDNYDFWYRANRMGGSMQAVTGHAYDDIVYRNKKMFEQHPEWLFPQPIKGTLPPSNPKFNLANEDLVQFVIKDATDRLETARRNNRPIKMISMSPSDGFGTCNSAACMKLGATITDRVYFLINKVAKAVNKKYPGTWVSGMSYSEYAEPPTKRLEPNTFVSIATAFNYSKYSTDQLISEWSKKAGKIGIYDYLGLYAWDFDLPGQSQASQVGKIVTSLTKYHTLGARGYDAETTPGAINKGLGHYIVSQLLWNINTNVSAVRKQFFSLCFGKAAGLIESMWNEWENYPYSVVRESDLASWMDIVTKAEKVEASPAVHRRLTHIKVYFHYLFLYNKFKATGTEADRIVLLTYCYNTNDWGAFSGYPALWVLGNALTIPGFKFSDPDAKYKKELPSFNNRQYIDALITADRSQLTKKESVPQYEPGKQFEKKTVIPSIFFDKQYQAYKNTTALTGPHNYVFEIKNQGNVNFVKVAAGFVTGGGSEKPVTLSFFHYNGTTEIGTEEPLLAYDYRGKMDTQQVNLKKLPKGLYLLKVYDPQKKYILDFSSSISWSIIVTPQNRINGYTRFMTFYVPTGISKFRVFKDISVILISPKGRIVDMNDEKVDEKDITVMDGESGFWMINFLSGKLHIEGVPPFMAIDPARMLVPKE